MPEPIETTPVPLAPPLPRPALPGTVVVRETADEAIDAAAADLFFQANACVRTFGDFHLALSGGKTPEPLYQRLMYDPVLRSLPWKRTHLWLVDERRVPLDDERSNFRMIRETIVDHSDIPREQVHPIPAMEEDAGALYEKELREHLVWRDKGHDRLDFVLLGMGADGHVASIFPESPALDARDELVVPNDGPTVTPPPRVTMTLTFLNAARFAGLLVLGESKRGAVSRVAAGARGPAHEKQVRSLPVLGLRPLAGELRWYLDRAACPEAC